MLPADRRVRRSEEFRRVVRDGVRVRRNGCVVHLAQLGGVPRVGFIVSRRVGNSVIRHRVTRRMRHAVRDCIAQLPHGCVLIIRALPNAAQLPYSVLHSSLSAGVHAACERLTHQERQECG